MLPEAFYGAAGSSQFLEDGEAGMLAETSRGPDNRDRELRRYGTDVSDVEMVCDLYSSLICPKRRSLKV